MNIHQWLVYGKSVKNSQSTAKSALCEPIINYPNLVVQADTLLVINNLSTTFFNRWTTFMFSFFFKALFICRYESVISSFFKHISNNIFDYTLLLWWANRSSKNIIHLFARDKQMKSTTSSTFNFQLKWLKSTIGRLLWTQAITMYRILKLSDYNIKILTDSLLGSA